MINEDLPGPLGPRIAMFSPSRTIREGIKNFFVAVKDSHVRKLQQGCAGSLDLPGFRAFMTGSPYPRAEGYPGPTGRVGVFGAARRTGDDAIHLIPVRA